MIKRFQPGDPDAFSSALVFEFCPPLLESADGQQELSIAWLAMWKLLAELVGHDVVLRQLILGDELDPATVRSLTQAPDARRDTNEYQPAWRALNTEPSPTPEVVLHTVEPVLRRAQDAVDRSGGEQGYRRVTAHCLDRILAAWPSIEESVEYFFTNEIQQLPITPLLGAAA